MKVLQSFRKCILTTTNPVGVNQSFGEWDFTTAKRVGGLLSFGECVLSTAKRVGCLKNGESGVCALTSGKRVEA